MTEDEAKAALREASSALLKIENDIRDEKISAAREIDQRRRSELVAARDVLSAANASLQEALDAQPPHEWDGRRVFRVETKCARWSRVVISMTRHEGVVETRRGFTQFPGNTARYNLPMMGAGFVRLLKKDGTPGLKFESLQGWRLVE